MMMLSKDRGSAPKDLGIDLLVLKEKEVGNSGRRLKMPSWQKAVKNGILTLQDASR